MKKFIIALILFLCGTMHSIALTPVSFESPCSKLPQEEQVQCNEKEKIISLIQQSNYCERDNDCMIADYGCPFGCGQFVNVQDDEKLKVITQNYHQKYNRCEYKCVKPTAVVCVNHICQIHKKPVSE